MGPTLQALQERVRAAAASKVPLMVVGGGSKSFYGNEARGDAFDVRAVSGIVDYEPTELVVSVRGGTPLAELEARLAEQNQMLPFEPPHFGPTATVGGTVSAGLAGPRRMAAGTQLALPRPSRAAALMTRVKSASRVSAGRLGWASAARRARKTGRPAWTAPGRWGLRCLR